MFRRKLIAALFVLCMILTVMTVSAFAAEIETHTCAYENGFCTTCDAYEPAALNGNVYEISNAGQLYWFANEVNSGNTDINGKLMADIVINENVLTADGKLNGDGSNFRGWTPIGYYTSSSDYARYAGIFDGNGKTVSGLYFNDTATTYVGLFGSVYEGTVQNVGVVGSYLIGNQLVGGVVGQNYYGTITSCYNTSSVSGDTIVGGVVGKNVHSTISGCYNTGSVSGGGDVGGVVGQNYYGTVTSCYNTGSVSSDDGAGGVVGYSSRCTISYCYNTGNVSGSWYVGGVAGYNSSGTVSNCNNTGSVSGSSVVGGVVANNYGTVINCYNIGSVSGSIQNTGGVVGNNYYSSSTVSNCYNTGSVSGSSKRTGGVVGCSFGTVSNCYNTGSVSGSSDVGGVVGVNTSDATISNCYYLSDCAIDGSNTIQYGIGISTQGSTTADVSGSTTSKSVAQFASGEVAYLLGEAFGQTIGTDTAPVLDGAKVYQNQISGCTEDAYVYVYSNIQADPVTSHSWVDATCTAPKTCSTCGTTEGEALGHRYDNGFCTVCEAYEPAVLNGDMYEISNAGQLYWFAAQVNDGDTAINGKLMTDIVVNENVLAADGTLNGDGSNFRVWTPIGYYNSLSDCAKYAGTFDGNGKTVSGLYFNDTAANYVGLFGFLYSDGKVQNVGVRDSYLRGCLCVGGVVGHSDGTVSNSYNTGSVSGSDTYVGGVVGWSYGSVSNCYNIGSISGYECVGGVVGFNFHDTVSNCFYLSGCVSEDNSYGTAMTAEQFASGEVAYLLQGNQTEKVWGQLIGAEPYPVLSNERVYFNNGSYSNGCNHDWVGGSCTEGVSCSICGAVSSYIPGHQWVDATCTDAKTCDLCGETEGEALGHANATYAFVNNQHTFTCGVCGETFTKASTDGKQLKFRSAAPLLGDCINVEFGIEIPAGFENVYVVFDFIGKQTKVDSYYVNASGRYVFEFPGINPQTIGESISSTVYATVDGVEVSLTYATYSVRTYCINQLGKATTPAALKTLIADLLIFGEKTQIMQNYKLDQMITEGVDLSAYASTFPGLGTEFNKQQMVGTANAAVGFKGVTLTLSGKMTIVVSLTADDISKYTFQAEVNGVVTTYQPEDLTYNATSGRYELSFDKMKASAFDDVITFSILENGVVTSKQLQYSVNSYIQKNQAVATGDMLALLQAIYNYGAAAKALNG